MSRSTIASINGLLPCPKCNGGEVRLQTPVEDDMVVRRAYFRCFGCGFVSPNFPGFPETPYPDHGKLAFEPLRKFWNDFVSTGVSDD